MPRKTVELDYAAKRNEILDAARQLVYTKGYEQTTIHDLLDALQISKGAFYHYFDSKQAVLEGLIDRLLDDGEQLLVPLLEDTTRPTLQRLHRYFDEIGRWKTAQKAYMLALLRVWYADHNAIVRQKVQARAMRRFAPLITQLVMQGHAEGVLVAPYPAQAGQIVLALLIGLNEALADLLLAPERHAAPLDEAERIVEAYNDALERILGAPAGSLHLVERGSMGEWFAALPAEPAATR